MYIFQYLCRCRAVEADGSKAEHLGALAVVEMQLARRPRLHSRSQPTYLSFAAQISGHVPLYP